MKLVSTARVLGASLSAAALLLVTACSDCCPKRTCCPAPCPPKPCCPSPCGAPAVDPAMPMPTPAPAPASTPAPAPKAGPETAAPAPKSLFDRLGGLDAIKAVTEDFFERISKNETILKNPAVAEHLQKADIAKFKALVVEQICEATGGPCKYTGRTMKEAHKGQNITDAEWDATVADFVAALDKFKVGAQEKSELLTALGGMKGDIVGQ